MKKNKAVYSRATSSKLRILRDGLVMMMIVSAVLVALLGALLELELLGITSLMWLGAIAVVPLLVGIADLPFYFKKKRKLIEADDKDRALSLKLADALRKLSTIDPIAVGNTEEMVEGIWLPFRVERIVSQSFRGELHGFSGFWGFVPKSIEGIIIPQLMDSCSVLFLQDKESEKTLRVLLPSPRAQRDMIDKMLSGWTTELESDTHTRKEMDMFVWKEKSLVEGLAHADLIDRIDASCQKAPEKRPRIEVFAKQIQPGVAIGTAIRVGEETSIFCPTGFIKLLSDTIVPLVNGQQTAQLEALV